MAAKKKGKSGKAKGSKVLAAARKKGGRDFRGIDRKTGKKDSGPGPIHKAMGAKGAPCY